MLKLWCLAFDSLAMKIHCQAAFMALSWLCFHFLSSHACPLHYVLHLLGWSHETTLSYGSEALQCFLYIKYLLCCWWALFKSLTSVSPILTSITKALPGKLWRISHLAVLAHKQSKSCWRWFVHQVLLSNTHPSRTFSGLSCKIVDLIMKCSRSTYRGFSFAELRSCLCPVSQQLSQHGQLLQLPTYCFSHGSASQGEGISKDSILQREGGSWIRARDWWVDTGAHRVGKNRRRTIGPGRLERAEGWGGHGKRVAAIGPAPGHWAHSIGTGNGICRRQMCRREVMNALKPNNQDKGEKGSMHFS